MAEELLRREAADTVEDILRTGFDEHRAYVNPIVSQRAGLAGEPVKLVGTNAGALVDRQGGEIEDFHGTQAFGHRHPAIAAAVRAFLESDAPSWFPTRVNPFAGRLGRRLFERTGYDNTYLACTGSGAVEAALKLSRALTRRPRLVGLSGAYHGCTFGSVSLMGEGFLREPFGPHLPGAETIPFGDVDALARALAPGDVAAVVVEPIQGEGGVRALPEPFIEALCELTERHGTLLVADEVQTGMGRTGRGILATHDWPRRPDAVIMAKHLGGGLVPVSVMLTSRELFMKAYGSSIAAGEAHNETMGMNGVGCVAALAALELLTDETIERIATTGAWLRGEFAGALEGLSLFREIRGAGFLLGIALTESDHPWLTFEHFELPGLEGKAAIASLLAHRLYRRGFFCYPCGHDWSVMRLQPRYDIPEERLAELVRAIHEELEKLCRIA